MSIYCKHCHDDLSDPGQIKVCQCRDAGDAADRNRRGSKDSNKDRKRFTSIPAIHDGLNELRNRKSPSAHSATNSTAHLVNHQVSDDGGSYRMGRVNSGYNGDDDAKFDEEDEHDEHIGRIFSSFEKKILYYMRYFGSPANWARRGLAEPLRDQYGDILDLSDGPRYDSTGLFWWCPPRPYEEVLLDRFQASQKNFKKHVVLIIFANENSSVIGLNNFVLPLRSSSSTYEELRDIVILGDPRFLNLEWPCLNNFPKITMVKVFGLSRADLRSVNIDQCEMCLLLSATAAKESQGMLLTDKDAILTSLTIKAMNFGVQEDLFAARPIAGRGGPVPLAISVGNDDAAATVAHQKLRMLSQSSSHKKNTTVVHGYAIPLLTELVNDENIQFVDQDDFDIEDFFMAEPFACGNAFATSVLQSLLVSTYSNPFTLAILRALIFGGVTPEFEQILSEGAGLIGGPNLSQRYPYANRCRLSQLSVQDVRFVQFSTGPYGSLFLDAIQNHNMLCLGLFRRIQKTGSNARSKRRYVITAPPKDFLLEADDKLFVIERIRSTLSW